METETSGALEDIREMTRSNLQKIQENNNRILEEAQKEYFEASGDLSKCGKRMILAVMKAHGVLGGTKGKKGSSDAFYNLLEKKWKLGKTYIGYYVRIGSNKTLMSLSDE